MASPLDTWLQSARVRTRHEVEVAASPSQALATLLGAPIAPDRLVAMLFERSADLIETVKCNVIEAACFTSHAKQLPAEVDSMGLRLFAILLPIGVEDFFDDVRIQKYSERREALEREPEANCDPDEGHKLSAPRRYLCEYITPV